MASVSEGLSLSDIIMGGKPLRWGGYGMERRVEKPCRLRMVRSQVQWVSSSLLPIVSGNTGHSGGNHLILNVSVKGYVF